MKKYLFVLSAVALLLAACAQSSEEKVSKEKDVAIKEAAKSSAIQDSVAADEGYQQKDLESSNQDRSENEKKSDKPVIDQRNLPQAWDSVFVKRNSNRKLIKTANLVFQVADVERTTIKIERLANVYGGFILTSGIRSANMQYTTQRINKDSVLEVGLKSISNDITLRVPEFLLDTVLCELSRLWIQLDERTLNAEDVTIDFLANELRARMYQKTATSINKTAQTNQKKLDDVVNAEATAAQYLENTIQKKIENLTLQDKIDYATITLHMYQDNVLYKKKSASYKLENYEPGFGSRFVDSLAFGWKIILEFILGITKAWSILLIMLCLFFVIYLPIRYSIRRRKNKLSATK
jgi:hypothetical protein